eukprot:UN04486
MFSHTAVLNELGGLYGVSYGVRSSLDQGIPEDEKATDYQTRKELYGTNQLPLPPVNPLYQHMIDALGDEMLIILIIGGIVSIITGSIQHPDSGWIEGVSILIAVLIVVMVGSLNNWNQEKSFLKLASSLKGAPVTMLRHGKQDTFDQDDIMVGDIIFLNPGSMIPADGLLIDNTSIKVNESALTGESDELTKNKAHPFMSAGTELTDGSCSMLVTAVGVNSAKGKLMSNLVQEQEPTKLQLRLEVTAKMVGYIGLTCAIATFIALLIRLIINIETPPHFNEDGELYTWAGSWSEIINYFIIAVTIVVVAIPEGLPLSLTLSLAYSMAKMRDDQNLVKVLSACETMGNATAISLIRLVL